MWPVILALGMLAAPAAAERQQQGKIPRIGWLSGGSSAATGTGIGIFREGLRGLGLYEGQNVAIESRFAGGMYDRLPRLAAELVALKVDVIVTEATSATGAAQRATRTIPIVMALSGDPVESGLIASLAHPGGNTLGSPPSPRN